MVKKLKGSIQHPACAGKLEKSGFSYGVFCKDGYADLFTNSVDEAIKSFNYLRPGLAGCVLAKTEEEKPEVVVHRVKNTMPIISPNCIPGLSYDLNSSQREFFKEKYQLSNRDLELGLVCSQGFTGEKKQSHSIVYDIIEGVKVPRLILGEIVEDEAVFSIPLGRYQSSKVRHVRMTKNELNICANSEALKAKVAADAAREEKVKTEKVAKPKVEKVDRSAAIKAIFDL